MEEGLVVLEFFADATQATIARGFLEANGIVVYLFDSDPAGQLSLHQGTNPDFAVRLMVDPSDIQDAKELLEGLKNNAG